MLKTSTRRMEESVWLHCNSCYNVASSDSWPAWLDVVFTNCGHVFCHTCFTAPSSYSSDSLCPSCGKSCQSTTFRKDSPPPRIQPWFEDSVVALERAIKVMRFQRGQEAALVRGLVRQIHRQKQESAVLWQHSPTQGSTDSFRTNAVDAWDLAMPGQVRQYPSPPGYQSDEYGIRPPFGLSPPPGLALNGHAKEAHGQATTKPDATPMGYPSLAGHSFRHSPQLIGNQDGLLVGPKPAPHASLILKPEPTPPPLTITKEGIAQFRYRPGQRTAESIDQPMSLSARQHALPSGLAMLGGGGARLPTPPTASTPDSILGREPPPFLQRQTLNSSRRLQDRLASFRQQQSSNGGLTPVPAKQSQLLMERAAPGKKRKAPQRRGLSLPDGPVPKMTKLSNSQRGSPELHESGGVGQTTSAPHSDDDHYDTFEIHPGKSLQPSVGANTNATRADVQKEE